MLYFHICQQFDSEFQQEDNATIRIVKKKLEHLQARKAFIPNKTLKVYDRAGLYVQRFMGQRMNMRILIQEYKFEHLGQEHVIYFLREYVPQSKYEPRWRNYILPEIEDGIYKERHPLSPEEIERAKKEYLDQIHNGLDKEVPPHALVSWFQEEGFGIEPEFRIYETQNWVTFSAEYGSNYLGDFFLILDSIYHQTNHHGITHELVKELEGQRNLVVSQYQEVYLIHETYLQEHGEQVEQFMLVHDGGILGQEFSEEERIRKIRGAIEFSPLKNIENEIYSENDFAKGAVRAYPANLLKDRKSWRAVQMYNNKSNLALSPEQLTLLKRYDFPKFINGQAGSGKSEMLYYLIAEVIFRQQVYEFEDKIIFLTENEELLKKALQDTRSKLVYNSQYKDIDLQNVDLQKYFSPFRRFLLDNFVDDPSLFPEDKFVNFSRFRKLYQNSNLPDYTKKRYSAEIAWYVIYTFIKGQRADIEALEIDGFENLYKKDKGRLDKGTFREVHEKIWKPFYSNLRKKGYWDQLDLVRDVLNRYHKIPSSEKLTVILCDESQDFTRIELQLIIRLSRFSDFDLSGLKQVPISFAGDPFQTVNPTGFSLEKLKRLFGKELEEELKFELSHDRLISELSYNYRSSSPIVDLANVVQYFRRRFLNTPDLDSPQEAKRLGKSPSPQLFSLDENARDLFNRLGKGVVYLVSCNDGEENDLVNKDPWLEEEYIVKSAARAKGSEYPNVAIYGFGQHFIDTYGEDMIKGLLSLQQNYDNLSSSQQFEISFFFNKLYVAITRAQEDCYVIDTAEGIAGFWEPIRQISALSDIDEKWNDAIKPGFLVEGNIEMVNNTDLESLLKIAKEEKENGLAFEDPDRLRDAAKAFSQVPDIQYKKDADYCSAKALEFEHKFEEAGDILIQYYNSFAYEANLAYLLGEAWEKILDQEEANSEKVNSLRFIAKIMSDVPVDINEALKYITKAEKIFNDRSCRGRLFWKNEFLVKLESASADWIHHEDKDAIEQLAGLMSSVKWSGDTYYNSIAKLYAFAGNHAKAVEFWELCEDYNHDNYYKAKLQTPIDTGEKIFYLFQLEKYEDILSAYEKDTAQKWQETDLRVVADAYLEMQRYEEVVKLGASGTALWAYLEEKIFKKRTHKKQVELFLLSTLSVVDDNPALRNTILTQGFIISIANFILTPYYKEENELNKLKRIAGRLKDAEGVSELTRLFIKLLARSKNSPKDFTESPAVYALVRMALVKGNIAPTNSISAIEKVCAIERTHDKFLDAIKAIRKLNISGTESSTFISNRIQKLQFKKVMIDVGAQGNTRLQNLEQEKEKYFKRLFELEQQQNKDTGFNITSLGIEDVDKEPLFPDFYSLADNKISEEEVPTPDDSDTEQSPKEEKGSNIDKDKKNGSNKKQVDPNDDLETPLDNPEEQTTINETQKAESTENKKTDNKDVKDQSLEISNSRALKEIQKLKEQFQGFSDSHKSLTNKIQSNEQAINELKKIYLELEDLKNSNSKLERENIELYRELAEVQRKYIALRDKN